MSGARRPQGRHRRERDTNDRAGRVLAAATVAVGLAVGLYSMLPASGASTNDDIASRTPTTTVDPSIAAFSRPVARAGTTEVGQERTAASADTVLLQVRKVPAPAGRTAPAGQEWFGIRARTCLHDGATTRGRVGWPGWVVVTDADVSYSGRSVPWTDFPAQQYGSSGLDTGECQVGWALVPVPHGTFRHVVEVTYRPGSAAGLTWQV